MKHSLEELQFAATVRDLALRRKHGIATQLPDAERIKYEAEPINAMILEVVEELEWVSAVIRGRFSQSAA